MELVQLNLNFLDAVTFLGHSNVKATNRSTIEVTTEDFLTPQGDCIIGILADKGCSQLSDKAKSWLQKDSNKVLIKITVHNMEFLLRAYGSSKLTHENKTSIVIRRSDFISDRTLAIRADAAAKDIPRQMIAYLQEGEKGTLEIYQEL